MNNPKRKRKREKAKSDDSSTPITPHTLSEESSSTPSALRKTLGLDVTIEYDNDDTRKTDTSCGGSNAATFGMNDLPPPFQLNDSIKPTKNKPIELGNLHNLATQTLLKIHQKRKSSSKSTSSRDSIPTLIQPTPIQSQIWPLMAQEEQQQHHHTKTTTTTSTNNNNNNNISKPIPNIIGISPTASGKTLSFVLPLIHMALRLHDTQSKKPIQIRRRLVLGLILVPTRELAIQVGAVLQSTIKVIKKIKKRQRKDSSTNASSSKSKRQQCSKDQVVGIEETPWNGNTNSTPDIDIVSVVIHGGVDRDQQLSKFTLEDQNDCASDEETSDAIKKIKLLQDESLMVVATPGRFVDLIGLADQSFTTESTNDTKTTMQDRSDTKQDSKQSSSSTSTSGRTIPKSIFQSLQALIIDEADRMAMNSDISSQVDAIIQYLDNSTTQNESSSPEITMEGGQYRRMTCLFSATMPQRIKEKCQGWVGSPRVVVKVDSLTQGQSDINRAKANDESMGVAKHISSQNQNDANQETSCSNDHATVGEESHIHGLSTIPKHVQQILHVCANHKKTKKLLTTLKKIEKDTNTNSKSNSNPNSDTSKRRKKQSLIMIFFARIKTLKYIHQFLTKDNIKSVVLFGQMDQQRREKQLNDFRSGKCPILLCTDVAARGLHIKNVMYVINYDFPSLEQYVHRCGRAGRELATETIDEQNKKNGISPTVYSFFNRELAPMAQDVIDLLRLNDAWVDPNLLELVKDGKSKTESNNSKKKRKKPLPERIEKMSKARKQGDKNVSSKNATSTDTCADRDKQCAINDDIDGMSEDEDEFADLGRNQIRLKRADVSEDSSVGSSDDER